MGAKLRYKFKGETMKISASIGSWTGDLQANIETLRSIDVDRVHIDVFDDLDDVPHIDFKNSPIPAEIHIVSSKPEAFFGAVANRGISRVLFQFENLPDNWSPPNLKMVKKGLSLLPETSIDKVAGLVDEFDYLTVMATVPGVSGKPFNFEAFNMIERLKSKWPEVPVHLDGGVTSAIATALAKLGVSEVVLGSFLANSKSHTRDFLLAKFGASTSSLSVRRAMVPRSACPVLRISGNHLTLMEIIDVLQSHQRGFLLMVDEAEKCVGVATEGDVRRLLRDPVALSPEGVVNILSLTSRGFAALDESASLLEAFEESTRLRNNGKVINFIPIVDGSGELVGVVDFRRIQEELN